MHPSPRVHCLYIHHTRTYIQILPRNLTCVHLHTTARSSRAQTLPERPDLGRARPPTLRLPTTDALASTSGPTSAAASPAATPRPATARSSPPLPPLPPLPRRSSRARTADSSSATPRTAPTPKTSFVFNDVFVSDTDLLSELLAIGAAEVGSPLVGEEAQQQDGQQQKQEAQQQQKEQKEGEEEEDPWPALCFVRGAERDGARAGAATARLFAPALVRQRRARGYRAWCRAMHDQALARLRAQERQQRAREQQQQGAHAHAHALSTPRGDAVVPGAAAAMPGASGRRSARLARQHSSQALMPRGTAAVAAVAAPATTTTMASQLRAMGAEAETPPTGSPRDAAVVLPSTQRAGAVVSRPARAATVPDVPLSPPASPRVAAHAPRHSRAPDAPPALPPLLRAPVAARGRVRSGSVQPDVPFRPASDTAPGYTCVDLTAPNTPSTSFS